MNKLLGLVLSNECEIYLNRRKSVVLIFRNKFSLVVFFFFLNFVELKF